jgi:nucleotide-binding universal stress UspA family protein
MPILKRILVPLDGSPLAELALRAALEFARLVGAEIKVVRAVDASGSRYRRDRTGAGGLGRLVLGSVVEAVLRRRTVAILLVRAEGAPLAEPVSGHAATRR